jgi:tRNA(fMet)-specific endonuclease VapC
MEKKGLVLCDSDVLIELIDRNNQQVFNRIVNFGFSNLCISSVSFSELFCGALNKAHHKKLSKELTKFILCEVGREIDKTHRELIIKYCLSHRLQVNDALIAATALNYQLPLYTLNASDFKFIKGLQLI